MVFRIETYQEACELNAVLEWLKYQYYIQSDPIVDDFVFDYLERLLIDYLKRHPEFRHIRPKWVKKWQTNIIGSQRYYSTMRRSMVVHVIWPKVQKWIE